MIKYWTVPSFNTYNNNDGERNYGPGLDAVTGIAADVQEYDATVFMAYKAFGNAGLTLRYTDGSVNIGGADVDYEKTTVSPSYAFSDSVFGLVEFSSEELGNFGDVDTAAAEIIFSF